MQTTEATQPGGRHFARDLAGLIARVIATAIAINIVLGGLVLMLATPAQAADAATAACDTRPATLRPTNAAPELAAAIDPLLIVLHRYAVVLCRDSIATTPAER